MRRLSRIVLISLAVIYFLRVIAVMIMGLMPQDAYYFYYAENLDWSYFDHPPMVANMLWVFTGILGKSVVSIKLTNFLTTLASTWCFYQLSKEFLSSRRAQVATVLLASTLVITILSVNTTPDVPLIFFTILSVWSIWRALNTDVFWYWPLAGFLMGLAFCSKYTALFLPGCLVLSLLSVASWRRYIFSLRFLSLSLMFLLGTLPVIIWNHQHDWISFGFQASDRAGDILRFRFQPKFFIGFFGTQLGLLLPPLFMALLIVSSKLVRKHLMRWKMPSQETSFLLIFSVPLILFFVAVSCIYWVKLNWVMPAYITAIILIARYVPDRTLHFQLVFAVGIHLLLMVQIVWYPISIKSDDTWFGWNALAEEVSQLQEQYPDHFVFSSDGYKTSAILNYYLDDTVYAGNVLGKPALHFDVTQADLTHLIGKSAIYIDSDKRLKNLEKMPESPNELAMHFESIVQLDPIIIRDRSGKPKRKFWIFIADAYRP